MTSRTIQNSKSHTLRAMAPSGAGTSLRDRPRISAQSAVPEPTWAGGAAAAPAPPVARRRPLRAALATMRPRQWIKNALVIGAAGAAGALGYDDVPVRVGIAFVAFCLLASGVYAINDVRDVHEDRLHPRKRARPVAAGELNERAGIALGVSLLVVGLALCAAVRPLLLLVGFGYAALTVSYTLLWRRVLFFDLVAIAGGFVLRAVAGGVAAPVTLSKWFLVVISAAAVLVAAGKRRAELTRTTLGGGARRDVLELYTHRLLDLILVGSAVVALFAYTMWAFAIPEIDGVPWRPLTLIPFAACIARYGVQVARGGGETPEDLVISDRWLLLAGLTWLVVFALGVHAAG
jgi:decaprenyl-phosphate phosphoribosyltransferase